MIKYYSPAKLDDSEEYKKVLEKMSELRARKNSDYDAGFYGAYDEYGFLGVAFDLGRKYSRIKTFSKTLDLKVSDETIEDTLMDLALLSINALLWFRLHAKRRPSPNDKENRTSGPT